MYHKNALLFCQKWGDLFFAGNFARRLDTRPSLLKFVEKMKKKLTQKLQQKCTLSQR